MKFLTSLGLAAVLAAASLGSQAAVVTSHYTAGTGTRWTVDLTVANDDGAPPLLSGFTVYFSENLFAGLQLLATPTTWDSIVIEPDPAIPDAGFLDSYAVDPADALAPGQSQAGFRVAFDYLGQGAPQSLFFEIVDANYAVLASGQSVVTLAPQAVPEPGSIVLAGLALAALCASGSARRAGRSGRGLAVGVA